ncbi:hypothetical protein OIU78_006122 [Salix suchowensis]|nr:hypothetical protein OIU78_006122 [Salix suchowensis]
MRASVRISLHVLLSEVPSSPQFECTAKINSKRSRSGFSPWFVTWKKVVNGGEPRLRGCVGTLEARSIITGFQDYALTSALRDRRFPPIQAKELPALECTVSILTDYETANHYLDWEVLTLKVVVNEALPVPTFECTPVWMLGRHIVSQLKPQAGLISCVAGAMLDQSNDF